MSLQNRYLDHIWKQWSTEYLSYLGILNPPAKEHKLKEGQLVQVLDHSIPRKVWKVGLITKLPAGRDGKIRCATVRTSGGDLTRSIQHIALLELDAEESPMNQETVNPQSNIPNIFRRLIHLNSTINVNDFDMMKLDCTTKLD